MTLITNRTQEDVDRVKALVEQIMRNGFSSLSAGEKQEYLNGMPGAYGITDLNRVGTAINIVYTRFKSLPAVLANYAKSLGVPDAPEFHVPYDPSMIITRPKQDWQYGDVPSQAQMRQYLDDIATLRGVIPVSEDTPAVPATMDGLTYQTANDIEQILMNVEAATDALERDRRKKIEAATAGYDVYPYCGITDCGA